MAIKDVVITYNIEPIVTLECLNLSCKYNLTRNKNDPSIYCKLKSIMISGDGVCRSMELVGDTVQSEPKIDHSHTHQFTEQQEKQIIRFFQNELRKML